MSKFISAFLIALLIVAPVTQASFYKSWKISRAAYNCESTEVQCIASLPLFLGIWHGLTDATHEDNTAGIAMLGTSIAAGFVMQDIQAIALRSNDFYRQIFGKRAIEQFAQVEWNMTCLGMVGALLLQYIPGNLLGRAIRSCFQYRRSRS